MIHMPRRSVTRFFIPLIDVLLLLFSIFLLMPAMSGEKAGEDSRPVRSAEELQKDIDALENKLKQALDDLRKLQLEKDPKGELEKMRAELEKLRKEKEQALQRPTFVRVIDIDGKTGNLSFFDTANLDNPQTPIPNQQAAKELIARHKKEAEGRQLYYHFLFPRQETGRPTQAQELEYRRWFAGVANSLKEKLP
jgi:biopolymer transport protein ExbD